MNNLAFFVRGPLLLALMSIFGLHYLVANVLSLCALTIARFALADALDLGLRHHDARVLRHPQPCDDRLGGRASRTRALPRRRSQRAAIDPRRGRVGSARSRDSATARAIDGAEVITYREPVPGGFAMRVELGERVLISVSPLVRRSPHVLYTNCVEPVLRWHLAEHGVALVHAACVAVGDRAYLITARTDTGKTTTILKLLDTYPQAAFISDDLTLVAPDGSVAVVSEAAHDQPAHAACGAALPSLTRRQRIGLVVQARLHSREGRSIGMAARQQGLARRDDERGRAGAHPAPEVRRHEARARRAALSARHSSRGSS